MYNVGNRYGFDAWMEEITQAFTNLQSKGGGQYDFDLPSPIEDYWRFSFARKGKGSWGKSSVTLDLRPGPTTPFGPSIEMVSPSGWSRVFGPEIFVPEEGKGAPELRSPIESFTYYMEAAFKTPAHGRSTQEIFQTITSRGSQNPYVGGGVLQYGPHHTEIARQEFASRVNISMAQGVYSNVAFDRIKEMMKGADDMWSALRGYAPWTDDDDITRLRRFTAATSIYGAGQFDLDVLGIGPDADKIIKHANISWGGGLREEAQLFLQNRGQRGPQGFVQVQPGQVTSLEDMQGYRKLDMLFPGETERRNVWIEQNVFQTPSSPFSGAYISYDKPLAGLQAGYGSWYREPLKIDSYGDLPNARYESGVFSQDKEGNWVRQRDLAGYRLAPGKQATIGLWHYGSGDDQRTQPIQFMAEGKGVVFSGESQMVIAKGYLRHTGEGVPGYSLGGEPKEYRELHDSFSSRYADKYMEQVRKNFPGEVRAIGMGGAPEVYIPYTQETGASLKGFGVKVTPMQASSIIGQALDPTVDIGGRSVRLSGFHGESKNPSVIFSAQYGALPRTKKAMMMGDVFPEQIADPLRKYIYGLGQEGEFGVVPEGFEGYAMRPDVVGKQVYSSAKEAQEAMFAMEDSRAYKVAPMAHTVSMERMAEIYNQAANAQLGPEEFMEEVRQRMLPMMEDMPGYTYEHYRMAMQKEGQWLPVGAVTGDERKAYRDEFVRAGKLRGMSNREISQSYSQRMRFEKAGDNSYIWSINSPGMIGSLVSTAVPEFQTGMPRITYEEMAALSFTNPDAAKRMGLQLAQSPGATGFRPKHVRAWEQMGRVYQYGQDPEGLMLPASERVTLNPEQLEGIASGMAALGEKPSLQEISEMMAGQGISGDQPLYNPTTGQLIPSPQAVRDITQFSYYGEDIEPVNRLSKQYPGLLGEFASSTPMDVANKYKNFQMQLANVASKKKGSLARNTMSRFVRGATGGRYVGATGLNMNELLVPEEQMLYALRGMATTAREADPEAWKKIKTDRWVRDAYKQIQEMGGVPIAWWRSPTLSRQAGMQTSTAVTPEIVARDRGIALNLPKGFTAGLGVGSTPVAGDWDADQLQKVLMALATPEGLSWEGMEDTVAMAGQGYSQRRAQIDQSLIAQFGQKAGVPGGEMDVIAKEMMGLIDPDMGKLTRSGLTKLSTEDLFARGVGRLIGKFGMGKAYNLRRGLEAAASTLGWKEGGIANLQTSGSLSYQEYLDYIRTDFRNVESVLQSIVMSEGPLSQATGEPVGVTISGMTAQGGWRELASTRAGGTKLGSVMRELVMQDNPRPEYALGMFSRNEEEMYNLIERYKGGEDTNALLKELMSSEGYAFEESPLGLYSYTQLWGRMTGQLRGGRGPWKNIGTSGGDRKTSALKRIQRGKYTNEPIPFMGGQVPIGELGDTPEVRETLNRYRMLTGEVLFGSELADLYDPDTPLGQFVSSLGGPVASRAARIRELATYGIKGDIADIKVSEGPRQTPLMSGGGGRKPPDKPRTTTAEPEDPDEMGGDREGLMSDREAKAYQMGLKAGGGGTKDSGKKSGGGYPMSQKLMSQRISELESGALDAIKFESMASVFATDLTEHLGTLGYQGSLQEMLFAQAEQDPTGHQATLGRYFSRAKMLMGGYRGIRRASREAMNIPGRLEDVSPEALGLLRSATSPEDPLGKAFMAAEAIYEGGKASGVKGSGTVKELNNALTEFEKALQKSTETVQQYGEAHKESLEALKEVKVKEAEYRMLKAQIQYKDAQMDWETAPEGPAQTQAIIAREQAAKEFRIAQGQLMSASGGGGGGRAAANVGMRRLLGGWNLFYMQRLLGLGVGAFQQGYSEYEQFMGAGEMQSIRALGADRITPRENYETQYQQAMLRSGGGVMRQIRGLQAKTAGTVMSDIGGAALTGLGIGTLADFVGPALFGMGEAAGSGMIGSALTGLGYGLTSFAAPIGLGVAAAALIGTQISYAANYEDSINQAASMSASGNQLSGAYRLLGPSFKDMFQTGDDRNFWTSAKQAGQWEERVKAYRQGAIPTGLEGGRMGGAELQRFSQIAAMTDIPELAHLSPDLKRQLIASLAGAGFGMDKVNQVGTAIQAGLPITDIAAGRNALLGGMPLSESQAIVGAVPFAGMTSAELNRISSGQQFALQLPGIQGYIRQQGWGTGDVAAFEQQMSGIVGGPWAQQYAQSWSIRQGLRDTGYEVARPDAYRFGRDFERTPAMQYAEMSQNMLFSRATSFRQKGAGLGVSYGQMNDLTDFGMMGTGQMGMLEGIMNMSPIRLTQAIAGGAVAGIGALPMGLTTADLANADIGLGGQITGLPWGTTGLQRGDISAQAMGQAIFTDPNSRAAQAAIGGINFRTGQLGGTGADVVGGMRGLRWLQTWTNLEAQEDQLGIRAQQLALQREFQPQFWNIEDRQRALSHRQSMWGFEYQQRQFDMQGAQFFENQAFNRNTTLMQRGWTRQDWGHQDMMRNMQWGWQQEDFQENVRFMSGRQRRLAERQMERQTIVHGIEGDRIDEQRRRQKEMWRIEDERYEMTIRHFQEQRNLQEENMEKQKEFYEEGKKLQDERIKLNREYWERNMQLQEQALGISQEQLDKNKEIQIAMQELSQAQEDYNAKWRIAQEFANTVLDKFIEALDPEKLKELFTNWEPSGNVPIPNESNNWQQNDLIPVAPGSNILSEFNVSVYLGNDKLDSYVTKAVENELRIAV